jgi:small subunit ribosomal protein S16
MLSIRLSRFGSKKRPQFRLVVTDSRKARDSRFVESLGFYNPRSRPATVDVDRERVAHWLKRGARPSDTVRTLLARHVTRDRAAEKAAAAAAGTAAAGSTSPSDGAGQ